LRKQINLTINAYSHNSNQWKGSHILNISSLNILESGFKKYDNLTNTKCMFWVICILIIDNFYFIILNKLIIPKFKIVG